VKLVGWKWPHINEVDGIFFAHEKLKKNISNRFLKVIAARISKIHVLLSCFHGVFLKIELELVDFIGWIFLVFLKKNSPKCGNEM
jgi:hypothetical protein